MAVFCDALIRSREDEVGDDAAREIVEIEQSLAAGVRRQHVRRGDVEEYDAGRDDKADRPIRARQIVALSELVDELAQAAKVKAEYEDLLKRLHAVGVEVRSRLFISESCPLRMRFDISARPARQPMRITIETPGIASLRTRATRSSRTTACSG